MKIICVGRNYREHINEMHAPLPEVPMFFLKPDTALLRNNQPFFYPDFSNEIHYEIEVVIKICKLGKTIPEKFAYNYFDQLGVGIDFTARDLQQQCKNQGMPWEISKGFDNSAVISNFIPIEELGDIYNLPFHLEINESTVQSGNTADMIFSFEKIIAYVSRFMTLRTGDLIYTGTPVGVGPVKINDLLEAYIGDRKMMRFRIK